METCILWIGFIGAWLLFAGPIYQAALELQDEDIEIDRIRAAGATVPKPEPASSWLWLVFPVKIYLEFKRNKQHRRQIAKALTKEDIESMVSFRSKSTGWLFVAFGGFCLAVKETYELTEHQEWSTAVLLAIVIVMFFISVLNLIYRLKRSKAILDA